MPAASLTPQQQTLLDRLIAERGIAAGQRPDTDGRIAVLTGERRDLAASFAQQRIWFFDRLQPDATIYNVAGAARLRGRLDVDLLTQCLTTIVERHEVLRTTYHSVAGRPVQTVRAAQDVAVPIVDLRDTPADERDAACERDCALRIRQPFDLTADLMVRPVLYRFAPDDHVLLLCQHHIATDGWSLNVLLREVGELYSAHSEGRPVRLPDLPVQYSDFAAWQRAWLDGPELERQLDHWRQALVDNRLVDVSTGLPRPATLGWEGGTLEYELDAELVAAARLLAEQERATLYMVLVAAYALVLGRWSDQDAAIVGCPVANRNRAEIEALIGCFVNELPLRVELSGRPSFRQLVRRAREACLGAYAAQDVPFERIVEAVNPERDAVSHSPLVRHQLGLHNEPRWRVELPDLSFEIAGLSTGTARFDLEVDLFPNERKGLTGTVYYSTDLFTEDVVTRLLDGMRTALQAAVQGPDTEAALLPIVGPAEATRLRLELGAATELDGELVPLADRSWAETVSAQATATPAAVAIVDGQQRLTYAELVGRSEDLAGRLAGAGVGAGHPVVVLVGPSAGLAVTLLAVARLGAVAVPVEPTQAIGIVNEAVLDSAAGVVVLDASRPAGLDPLVIALSLDQPDPVDVPRADPPLPPWTCAEDDRAFLVYRLRADGSGLRANPITFRAVAHRLAWARQLAGGSGGRVLVQRAAVSRVPWDLLAPLTTGATVQLAEPGDTLGDGLGDGPAVLRCQTTAVLGFLEDLGRLACTLAAVVVDGCEPWRDVRARTAAAAPAARLYHLAGPADAALDVIARTIDPVRLNGVPTAASSTVAGAAVSVLDPHGGLVPIGVPGVLWLDSSDGPREAAPTSVRTEQRARWLPSGALELLGPDVRRRGHRVELTEIAGRLADLPDVSQAHVVALDASADQQGGEQQGGELVAYVDLRDRGRRRPGREQFLDSYTGRSAEADPCLNPGGWNSPDTGEYLSPSEMRSWNDATLRRVLAFGPADVLELGCRTGGLLFKLAPRVSTYVGVDPSPRALAHIREHQDWLADKVGDVRLLETAFDDLADVADRSVDIVVLNAATSYFPDVAYLQDVLREAIRTVRPGGHIYLAAVRNLGLLPTLMLGPALERAGSDAPVEALRGAVHESVAAVEELALAPSVFLEIAAGLTGVAEVVTTSRVARQRNELTGYRYDVILRLAGGPAVPPSVARELDWSANALTTAAVAALLADPAVERLRLTGVPDARHAARTRALDLLAQPSTTSAEVFSALAPAMAAPGGPIDPAELTATANSHGWTAVIRVTGAGNGALDVVFVRGATPDAVPPGTGLPAALAGQRATTGANDPLSARLAAEAVPVLRAHLQEHLPTYAVPRHVLVVPRFEWSHDGALDRSSLPMPDLAAADTESRRLPQSDVEIAIAKIWSDTLGVDRLSVHDDFFALGGHSLLGAEVIESVRTLYEVDVPLGRLFESPTVAAVAGYVEQQLSEPRVVVTPLVRLDRGAYRERRAARLAGR